MLVGNHSKSSNVTLKETKFKANIKSQREYKTCIYVVNYTCQTLVKWFFY